MSCNDEHRVPAADNNEDKAVNVEATTENGAQERTP